MTPSIVEDLTYISYAAQRDAGATFEQCSHPMAYGKQAVKFEERYQERGRED